MVRRQVERLEPRPNYDSGSRQSLAQVWPEFGRQTTRDAFWESGSKPHTVRNCIMESPRSLHHGACSPRVYDRTQSSILASPGQLARLSPQSPASAGDSVPSPGQSRPTSRTQYPVQSGPRRVTTVKKPTGRRLPTVTDGAKACGARGAGNGGPHPPSPTSVPSNSPLLRNSSIQSMRYGACGACGACGA